MSLEEVISANTVAVAANNAALALLATLLRQSNDGREAAVATISAMEKASVTPPVEKAARQPRKSKDEPTETVKVTSVLTTQPPVAKLPDAEAVRTAFGDWMGETDDAVERENRKGFVKALIDHFGARPAELEPEKMAQVLFYLARHRAGIAVDFGADYDFAGDPKQGAAEVNNEDSADDMFG